MVQHITSPELDGDGDAAKFQLYNGSAWANAYWYLPHTAYSSPVSQIVYDFYLYIPSTYANSPQAIEFEAQQNVNNKIYNFAWQANYGGNNWRVFNYATKSWEATSVPFSRFSTNTWHHIVAVYATSGSYVIHKSLTIDGQTTTVNISHLATSVSTGNGFTNAFQLDANSAGTGYYVYVDNMSVSVTQ